MQDMREEDGMQNGDKRIGSFHHTPNHVQKQQAGSLEITSESTKR